LGKTIAKVQESINEVKKTIVDEIKQTIVDEIKKLVEAKAQI